MKYTIQIPKPCTESWDKMTPTKKGRHCGSCQKNVIDFTRFSDSELAKYVQNNEVHCGRFLASQLNHEIRFPQTKTRFPIRLFLGISSVFAGTPLLAQENKLKIENIDEIKISATKYREAFVTIKGMVYDETGALPGANVTLKDSRIGTQTDIDGVFTLKIPEAEFNHRVFLEFQFIGMETKEVEVFRTSDNIKVEMKGSAYVGEAVVTRVGGMHLKKQSVWKRFTNVFRKKNPRY